MSPLTSHLLKHILNKAASFLFIEGGKKTTRSWKDVAMAAGGLFLKWAVGVDVYMLGSELEVESGAESQLDVFAEERRHFQ